MARSELRGPDFVVSTARVGVLPGVADIEGVADHALADVVTEEAFEQVFVDGQGVLRENRVAELLELVEDLVVQAGVVMLGRPYHHDPDAVFALELIDDLTGAAADAGFILSQSLEAGLDGAVVLFERETEDRLPGLQHLVREQLAVGEVENWIDVLHVVLAENVVFLS